MDGTPSDGTPIDDSGDRVWGAPPPPPNAQTVGQPPVTTELPMSMSPEKKSELGVGLAIGGGLVTVGVLFAVWAVLTSGSEPILDETQFPTIGDTFRVYGDGFRGVSLLSHVGATLGRVAIALVLGGGLGVAVGAAMGTVPAIRAFIRPVAHLFVWLSPVLLLPFVILWVGIGSAWMVAAMSVFSITAWQMSFATRESRDGLMRDLPQRIVFAARSALPFAWALVFISELIGAREGLGAVVFSARPFFRTDVMLAYALVAMVLAMLLDGALALLQRALKK